MIVRAFTGLSAIILVVGCSDPSSSGANTSQMGEDTGLGGNGGGEMGTAGSPADVSTGSSGGNGGSGQISTGGSGMAGASGHMTGGSAGSRGSAGSGIGGSGGSAGSSGIGGSAGNAGAGGNGGAPTLTACKNSGLALTAGTWTDITPPTVGNFPCTDLQFDPGNTCTLYAVYGGGGGIWKSTDGGHTWAQIGDLPMPNSLGRILVDPRNAKRLYTTGSVGGSSLGFWISTDGGDHWEIPSAFKAGMAAGTWTNDVYNMVVDPTDFNHVVLTLHFTPGPSAPIVESKDGGQTFVAHAAASGMDHAQGIAMLYDPALGIGDAKTWLVGAGYGSGIFRTTDAGETWTKVSDVQQNHGGFDVHYSAQGFLHVGVTGSLIRSTDNGVTWTSETNGVPYGYYYSVIGDGHRLYTSQAFVGVDQNQPFITSSEGGSDEGKAWTKYGTQVLPSGPWKMTFDSASGVIYNASWGKAWALKVAP